MEYIAKLELDKLAFEVMKFIENEKHKTTALPGGPVPSVFTELAIAQFPANAAVADLLFRSVMGGDPDGAPGVALLDAKRQVMDFHQSALDRLSGEVRALESRYKR